MNRLRNRLLVLFLAGTLVPLGATLLLTLSLLDRSLTYASTRELDGLSRALEQTGRAVYQRARQELRRDVAAGRVAPERLPLARRRDWPAPVRDFWESHETERLTLAGEGGDRVWLLVREPEGVRRYTHLLGGLRLGALSGQHARARALVDRADRRDLRRGFSLTLVVLVAAVWTACFALLVYGAYRVSRPIQELAAALAEVGRGNLTVRVEPRGRDEIGVAVAAFNEMTTQLAQSRDRLVFLTRLSSWQALGRKMAHELKNSLTPIRLTVEEIVARQTGEDRVFLDQAAQIVIDEVAGLERRVRAFSDLAAEPPVHLEPVDLGVVLAERVAFLGQAHPLVRYEVLCPPSLPLAEADADLLRATLTNLLENAAQAMPRGGTVRATASRYEDGLAIEIHDSGPGLSAAARESLYAPTISFKKGGMGLGLSIARKSALLCGGDIALIDGELGGAAFRVTLPRAGGSAPAGEVPCPASVSV